MNLMLSDFIIYSNVPGFLAGIFGEFWAFTQTKYQYLKSMQTLLNLFIIKEDLMKSTLAWLTSPKDDWNLWWWWCGEGFRNCGMKILQVIQYWQFYPQLQTESTPIGGGDVITTEVSMRNLLHRYYLHQVYIPNVHQSRHSIHRGILY